MELSTTVGHVTQITVRSHQVQTDQPKVYVLYNLAVRATTPYMHKMARFDRNACLPLDVPVFTVKARYSQLLKLHKHLVEDFPEAELPEFPPKKWMRNTSIQVIDNRKKRLENYFHDLLKVPKLSTAPTFLRFFCSPFTCRIAVVGASRIGKASFVDAFCLAEPLFRHTKVELALNSSQLITTRGPIDIIVDNSLVRISKIDTFTVPGSCDYDELVRELNEYEAVLVAYAPWHARTSEVASCLTTLLRKPVTSIVSLGSGDVASTEVHHADQEEEVYNIFEILVRKARDAKIQRSAM